MKVEKSQVEKIWNAREILGFERETREDEENDGQSNYGRRSRGCNL